VGCVYDSQTGELPECIIAQMFLQSTVISSLALPLPLLDN